MINTIIFDFGDIFVNLEKEATIEEFKKLGLNGPNEELLIMNDMFERGKISEQQFIDGFKKFIHNADVN